MQFWANVWRETPSDRRTVEKKQKRFAAAVPVAAAAAAPRPRDKTRQRGPAKMKVGESIPVLVLSAIFLFFILLTYGFYVPDPAP